MEDETTLTFRNGHQVTLVARGTDERGPYLRLCHTLPKAERQAGPHWHPELTEWFTIRQGRARFKIDGVETIANPGDTMTAPAGAVHEFWTEAPNTLFDHEIRPPLRHWEMFQLWHKLDVAGKTTRSRLPRNPLALALLWDYQDGYLGGVPRWAQHLVLGGLARLATLLGYRRRWAPAPPVPR
ncbi:cupin domain-containing protein [Nocardia altamirensis]|uniref:cupin domain-containing protein n=1 Tax=Nocardia altamirensis TaxID=472158 RepID=UPI0008408A9A|nr:cupin domain-containing protein [Nocardia altamirensis]